MCVEKIMARKENAERDSLPKHFPKWTPERVRIVMMVQLANSVAIKLTYYDSCRSNNLDFLTN